MSGSAASAAHARELARHYLEVAQPARALDALARAGGADPDDPDVWALRGWALVDLDRPAEAARAARDALERWPEDVDFLRLLAVAESQRDHLAEAEAAVLAALRLEPGDPHLLGAYADALMRGGQLAKAEAVLGLAARAEPDDALVLRLRLNLAWLRRDGRAARELAERLLARDADDPQAHAMLGALDLERGRVRRAETRLATAVRHDPSASSVAGAARAAALLRRPAYWPLLPFERFGVLATWIAAVALIGGLRVAGLATASVVVAVVWLVLCAYTWIAAPALARRAGAPR